MPIFTWIKRIICLSVIISCGSLIYLFPDMSANTQYAVFIIICTLLTFALLTVLHPITLFRINPRNSFRNSTTILVVDDNIANRRIISKTVGESGYNVLEADNGEQALSLHQQNAFPLILMDIEMQIMNGIDTVKKIRSLEAEDQPRVPIIAISAHNDIDKKIQALAAGYDDYLIKPVEESQLQQTLSHWLSISKPQITQTDESQKNRQQTTTNLPDSGETPNNKTRKIVDISQSLTYSHNNHELARDMLSLLISMIRDEKNTMQTLFAKKSWEPLGHLVHKLNGGCCYCGVPELQKQAEFIDKALQNKQYDQVSNHFHKLTHAMDDLLAWDDEYDIDVIFLP